VTRLTVRVAKLPAVVGSRLGPTGWHAVTQEQVDAFARATGDDQWIHVDAARAAAGPFGRPVGQGSLTLALAPELLGEILVVEDASLVLNYGLNRVRFPAPVPVGSRVRVTAEVVSAEPVADAVQAILALIVELEDGDKPACVAEVVFRYYSEETGSPARRRA
jgi:acyl dehydratase